MTVHLASKRSSHTLAGASYPTVSGATAAEDESVERDPLGLESVWLPEFAQLRDDLAKRLREQAERSSKSPSGSRTYSTSAVSRNIFNQRPRSILDDVDADVNPIDTGIPAHFRSLIKRSGTSDKALHELEGYLSATDRLYGPLAGTTQDVPGERANGPTSHLRATRHSADRLPHRALERFVSLFVVDTEDAWLTKASRAMTRWTRSRRWG